MTDTRKSVVLAPVTVTLLVPVEVELPDDLESEGNTLGTAFADIEQREDAADLIVALTAAMSETPAVMDALGSLIAGAQLFQKEHPAVRGRYTPYLGIATEQEL